MKKDTDNYTFIVLILIGIIFLYLNLIPGVNMVKNIGLNVVVPSVKIIEYPVKSSQKIYDRAKLFKNIFEENREMKSILKSYEIKYKDLNYFKKENRRLNRMLDFDREQWGELIPVRRIMQNSENYFTGFNILGGRASGIKKNSPVLVPDDDKWVLLGRVAEVFEAYSKVTLITSPAFKCGVEIGPGYGGVMEGMNSWLYNLKYISPIAEITPGDKVYTSGDGGIFPGGLYIGKIEEVNTLSFSKGKEAIVRGKIYPQDVKYMFVQKIE